MKKIMVKTGLLFVWAIILTVVSIQAQSPQKYDAQIPFDFKLGNKTYKSGNYSIELVDPFMNAFLTLANAKTRKRRQMPVTVNGSRSRMDKTVLIFDRYADQYIMTEIVSSEFGLSTPKSKVKKRIAQQFGQPEKTVAIVLTKRGESVK